MISALMMLALIAVAGTFLHRTVLKPPAYLANMGGNSMEHIPLHYIGGTMNMSALRGKVVLLYFGYTHCPDACPRALG